MWLLLALAIPVGTYVSGDGLGVNWTLEITAEGRFAFEWLGCLGRYDENRGTAVEDGPWIVLQPEKPRDNGFARQLPLRWYRLEWGDRRYLIAEDEFQSFVDEFNSGNEPRRDRQGSVLLRELDWTLPPHGVPTLPEPWSGALRASPIRAKVAVLQPDGGVVLDRGMKAGFAKGLQVFVSTSEHFAIGRVAHATEDVARVVFEYGKSDVRAGDPISTRIEE